MENMHTDSECFDPEITFNCKKDVPQNIITHEILNGNEEMDMDIADVIDFESVINGGDSSGQSVSEGELENNEILDYIDFDSPKNENDPMLHHSSENCTHNIVEKERNCYLPGN